MSIAGIYESYTPEYYHQTLKKVIVSYFLDRINLNLYEENLDIDWEPGMPDNAGLADPIILGIPEAPQQELADHEVNNEVQSAKK